VTKLSIYTGLFLILLGIATYIIAAASPIALIPAFFGLAFVGLGLLEVILADHQLMTGECIL